MAKNTAFSVFYYSRGGNTRKVAEAMAAALNVEASVIKSASAKDIPEGAFLLVGSGVYGGKTGREMTDFLQSLPQVKGGKAATFETSGNGKKVTAGKEMGGLLEKRGYEVRGSFVCPGKFFYIMRRGCPCPEHLKKAASFAKGLSAK